MANNDLLFQLDNNINRKNYAEINEDGHKVVVSVDVSNNICNICTSTKLYSQKNTAKILEQMNSNQNSFRYEIEKDNLLLKTSLWVDRKPTSTALKELINILVSQLNMFKTILESGD